MSQQFGKGAIIDRPDNRDHQWSEVGFGAAPFDWGTPYDVETSLGGVLSNPAFKLPVKNQNGSYSCGGQAWSQQAGVLEAVATHTFEERSARFIYSQTHQPSGGSAGRDNAIVFNKQGAAREGIFSSYDGGNPPGESFMQRNSDISDAVRLDAGKSKATSYANVAGGIDVIAQAIRENHGVILGLCGTNNGTWMSEFPNPPHNESPIEIWRHWIYAGKAKLINGEKHIGVLNSWGTAAGNNGWQWLSKQYIEAIIPSIVNDGLGGKVLWQTWTHILNLNPVSQFSHNFATDIVYGDNGTEVVALQQALQVNGEFPLGTPCTGYYGEITRRAVLAFQLKYSVAPQSELVPLAGKRAGVKTRAQLNALYNH